MKTKLNRTTPPLAALVLAAAVLSSGCKEKSAPANATGNTAEVNPDAVKTDAANLAEVPNQQQASASSATAQATAATQPAPTPPQPAPQKVVLRVAAGSTILVRINERLDSRSARAGDPFTGELTAPLTTQSGETVFAKRTPVSGHVVSARSAGRFKGAAVLAIEVGEIDGRPVKTSEFIATRKGKGKRTAGWIGGTSGAGMLIGGIASGGVGLVAGGLAGAGAGTAGAALTGNKALVLRPETVVRFVLKEPLEKTVER